MSSIYRDIPDIPLEDLEQLLQLLQDVQVSPEALFAYASAVDLVAEAAYNCVTVEDAFEMDKDAQLDDSDFVESSFLSIRKCLCKMGELK